MLVLVSSKASIFSPIFVSLWIYMQYTFTLHVFWCMSKWKYKTIVLYPRVCVWSAQSSTCMIAYYIWAWSLQMHTAQWKSGIVKKKNHWDAVDGCRTCSFGTLTNWASGAAQLGGLNSRQADYVASFPGSPLLARNYCMYVLWTPHTKVICVMIVHKEENETTDYEF